MPGIFLVSTAVLLRIFSNPIANVFQKQLTGKGIHPLFVSFVTYFLLSLFCVILAVLIHWPEVPVDFWIFSVLGGIAGAFGNGFLTKALQYGELSVLGPELEIRKKLIGSAIMIVGSVVIILLKNG